MTSTRKILIGLAVVFTFPWLAGASEGATNRGTEFLVGFSPNFGPADLSLIVTADTVTTGTVEVPGVGITPFSVPAGSVVTIPVPAAAQTMGSDSVAATGIRVMTGAQVSVFALNQFGPSLDGALVLPTSALGTEYLVLTAAQSQGQLSQFLVVSGQDDTIVTITPSVSTSGHPAGQPYTVPLGRLQTYQLQSDDDGEDLTGSHITSTKPIAVFAGGSCLSVPVGASYCSHLVEQLPPTTAWGTRFLVVPLATSFGGGLVRIIARDNATTVITTAGTSAMLNAGQAVEIALPPDTYHEIRTNNLPVLVMQYSKGSPIGSDPAPSPFMLLVPPVEGFLPVQRFATPNASGFQHYVGLVLAASDVDRCTLDGVVLAGAAVTLISTSGFAGARVPITGGAHVLACPHPFGALVYGAMETASYGYPAGLSLSASTAPVADAGRDVTVLERTQVVLDGTGSRDPSGAPLSFTWIQIAPASPQIALDLSDPARPSFMAPDVADTTVFTFSLVVTSASNGPSAPALVNVTVIDSGVIPPGVGCQSTVTTIVGLKSTVTALATSKQTIALLQATLKGIEAALASGRNNTARDGMVLFLGEVVLRSNLGESVQDRILPSDANRLICAGANVLITIAPR